MSRIKYGIKPNQSSISKSHKIVDKKIRAYKIDAKEKKVIEIITSNSFTEIKKELDFYNCDEYPFRGGDLEVFFIGTDKDYEIKDRAYKIKGIDKAFYGNGILVKFSNSGDYEKLQSVKSSLELFSSIVIF